MIFFFQVFHLSDLFFPQDVFFRSFFFSDRFFQIVFWTFFRAEIAFFRSFFLPDRFPSDRFLSRSFLCDRFFEIVFFCDLFCNLRCFHANRLWNFNLSFRLSWDLNAECELLDTWGKNNFLYFQKSIVIFSSFPSLCVVEAVLSEILEKIFKKKYSR